jgi:hypothetical protein
LATRTLDVNSLGRHFESMPDPRHTRNRRHRLVDVMVIAVCGVTVGCDGPTAIARWARHKHEWLAGFLELPHGIPSRDCFRRVLSALKPAAFQKCFESLIANCVAVQDADPESDLKSKQQGQRTLSSCTGKDFGEELVAPACGLHLSSEAILEGMLLQLADGEPSQPGHVVG